MRPPPAHLFDRIVAVVGTGLCALPFVAMLLLSLVVSILERRLLVDVLMPFDLFPVYLAGAIGLQLVGFRVQRHRLALSLSTVLAMAALLGSQALAQATGLSSGERAPEGWPVVGVIALLVVTALAMLVTTVAGARLARALWRPEAAATGEAGDG